MFFLAKLDRPCGFTLPFAEPNRPSQPFLRFCPFSIIVSRPLFAATSTGRGSLLEPLFVFPWEQNPKGSSSMGSKRWQQRRTGKVKRRLQFSNFTFISDDCDFCQGDLSQSSCGKTKSTKGNLSYRKIDEILDTQRSILALHVSESADEVSLEVGLSSQSVVLGSTDGMDSHNYERKEWASYIEDLSHSEALVDKKSWSHSTQESKQSVLRELSSKRSASLKDEQEQRRGLRKRKPKVPFEEQHSVSQRPPKKLRQIRIMRHLGLAAPYGSPFIISCVVRTSA